MSLRGNAAVMCQHVDELLAAVGNATCGGAIQEKANNLFLSRLQRNSEDINQYCASLQMLFNRARRAYDEDQRSFLTFSRQFLSGLRNRDVARAIIEREPPVGQMVDALREAAITIEERRNYFKQSNIMNKALAGGHQAPGNPGLAPGRSHSEPMELGSINQQNKGKKPSGNSNSVSNANVVGGNGQKKNPPKNGQNSKPQNSAKAALNQVRGLRTLLKAGIVSTAKR